MKKPHLAHGPLEATLVVLRFSPIVLMANEYIPKIQDEFRKKGLPEFKVTPLDEGDERGKYQWQFFDLGGTELVIINDTTFSYQTFSYTHYDDFKKRMITLMNIFFDTSDFFSGTILYYLGMRYINAIKASNWRDYLTTSFHGIRLPKQLMATQSPEEYHGIFMQGVTQLKDEQTAHIIVKTIQNKEGLRFPPDIVLLKKQEPLEGIVSTILDIDHFIILGLQPNDSTLITTTLDQLHDGCELVFFEAISERALKEWK